MLKKVTAVVATVMLSACGHLVNNSNPTANLQVDKYECSNEAIRNYPVIMGTKTIAGSNQSNCVLIGQNMQCSGTSQPAQVVSNGIDENSLNRMTAENRCLSARGWVRVRD